MDKLIVISCTTYGSLPRANKFWHSVNANLEPGLNIRKVMLDDGTLHLPSLRERREFCRRFGIHLIEHGNNRGIPAAWNSIMSYSMAEGAWLTCIFNDDLTFLAPGWLSRMIYFFEKNRDIGMVGLPLVQESGFKSDDSRWDNPPGRVGAAVGCAFGVQPETWALVKQPDGSTGFYETLKSFHEEVDLGFELAKLGKLSYMLPFPPCWHMGGATFQANPELVWTSFPTSYDINEFLYYAKSLPWYIEAYEKEYAQGKVDRMMFSRWLFCRKWGVFNQPRHWEHNGEQVDSWAEPQRKIHEDYVTPHPARQIRWLDKMNQPRECWDK